MFRDEPIGTTYGFAELGTARALWPSPKAHKPVNERAGVCVRAQLSAEVLMLVPQHPARQQQSSHQPIAQHFLDYAKETLTGKGRPSKQAWTYFLCSLAYVWAFHKYLLWFFELEMAAMRVPILRPVRRSGVLEVGRHRHRQLQIGTIGRGTRWHKFGELSEHLPSLMVFLRTPKTNFPYCYCLPNSSV